MKLGRILAKFGGHKSAASQAQPVSAHVKAADLHILDGNRAEEAGDLSRACECYRKAVAAAPGYAAAHVNLGIGLEAIGNIPLAGESYEEALRLDPADVFANYNLGRQLFSRQAFDGAEPLLRRAIEGKADFADARVVLSRLLENKGDLHGAATELEQALRVQPKYFGALSNYADVLLKLGRADDAAMILRRAVAEQPSDFETNHKLAAVLLELGRPAEAESFFEQALRCNPASIEVLASLVNLQMAQGNLDKAVITAEAALALRPDWRDLLFNYGLILKRLTRQAQAEAALRRAIEIDRTFVRAYHILGAVLISQGRIQDALDTFAEGRNYGADVLDFDSTELFALNCKDDISVDDLFAQHVGYGKRLEETCPARFHSFGNIPDPDRRLRIGFISGDLHYHVVSQFLLPLLEALDRSAVEVVCYYTGDTVDTMTDQVRKLADVWHATRGMPQDDIADLIHDNRIDILVDLAGHSGVQNLRVFAQQPAPIQVTWLGYLNTTGLSRIQYRISDNQCDPPGLTDRYHTETLVRLPHSQWCYRPFVEVAYEHESPFVRNGHVTFGSFNQMVKITPAVCELWGDILTQVPQSKLVILGVVHERAQEILYGNLETAGVDRSRITMVPYVALQEYYQWHARVDISLDTMPFSGGTTTCDALYMGAPVITLPGVRSWSRSAASILTTLGMTDCIAESTQDYVGRAVQLAQDTRKIEQMRTSLRSKMTASPLMDKQLFARDMENAFRNMWRTWCARTGDQ